MAIIGVRLEQMSVEQLEAAMTNNLKEAGALLKLIDREMEDMSGEQVSAIVASLSTSEGTTPRQRIRHYVVALGLLVWATAGLNNEIDKLKKE